MSNEEILARAEALRQRIGGNFRDKMVKSLYGDAEKIAQKVVKHTKKDPWAFDRKIDSFLTSPLFGFPTMLIILGIVFWITIAGANVPSAMLADALFWVEGQGVELFTQLGSPSWLTGIVWNGTYKALAWVVAVMLPPMAIFFPLFTFLEDLGYLPRAAFNLDWLFKKAGAHGKQALTMSMGFGCNAAGVIACRIIDSPRERLIATLTNNFVPCNGRFPTLIMLASIFVGGAVAKEYASLAATGAVVAVVILGIVLTLFVSALLSRTVLRGEASAFTLELPPYRRPNIGQILYTSIIDRTIFVLWRAMVVAAPAGAVIWILANTHVGSLSLAAHLANFLNPLGKAIALDGAILVAYLIAIPANEIVVPTLLMVYLNQGVMSDIEAFDQIRVILVEQKGWTLVTAFSLMTFCLVHNPCATTIYTMWKETKSWRWTLIGALLPLILGLALCFLIARGSILLGLA